MIKPSVKVGPNESTFDMNVVLRQKLPNCGGKKTRYGFAPIAEDLSVRVVYVKKGTLCRECGKRNWPFPAKQLGSIENLKLFSSYGRRGKKQAMTENCGQKLLLSNKIFLNDHRTLLSRCSAHIEHMNDS